MLAVPLLLAALLCGGAARMANASDPAEPRYEPATPGISTGTVTGWVVDANDWLDRGFLGVRHKQSAVTSADLGEPLVILTDSGSIVYPVTMTSPSGPMMDNVRLIPFAEQRIIVTGRVLTRAMERGVIVDGIVRTAKAVPAVTFPAREVADSKVLGRVTALSCWLGRADTGTSYIECTRAHAEAGEPLILVTDSGYMYYPVNRDTMTDPPDFTKLVKYCEQKVVVSGTVITRGKARAVVIDSVAAFTPDESSETLRPEDKK
jgi:hypothetical protein